MSLPTAVLHGRSDCTGQLRTLLCGLAPGLTPGLATGLAAVPPGVSTDAAAAPAWVFDPLPARVLLSDLQFADWPLDEPAVLGSLSAWLRPPGRALQVVGHDFAAAARRFPRFARWRRDWAHRVEAWQPTGAEWPAGQRLLLAPTLAAQWLDAPNAHTATRLRVITNAVHVQALHAQSADFLQRCEPAWPVTTLGL